MKSSDYYEDSEKGKNYLLKDNILEGINLQKSPITLYMKFLKCFFLCVYASDIGIEKINHLQITTDQTI